MAGASRDEVFNISREKYYQALVDYSSYAKILSEVSKIEVLERSESWARVQYTVNIVKSFVYVLKMTQKSPELVSWDLDSGSLFKKNSGSWHLKELGPDRCQVTYSLDVELKIFAPKTVTNALVSVNLPRMMQSFYEHAKKL